MKFATLFLIASAVLALPTGEKANNIVELAKKEAAPADGFRFPTEDEDVPKSENYSFKPEDDQVSESDKSEKNQTESPLKNQKDNNNRPCSEYFDKEAEEVPEECMKSVFCRNTVSFRIGGCSEVSFTKDNWTKEKLINEGVSTNCVGATICKWEEYYDV